MRQQSQRPPARGARFRKNSGCPKNSTLAAGVPAGGRARISADETGRAFAAGVRFALERLADIAGADAETIAAYARLLEAVNGGRR
jgi:hypothetical protein